MKIALIGPGIMPIPPPGWGAVEILLWDYYLELKTHEGVEVDIINHMRQYPSDQSGPHTEYSQHLIKTINDGQYDFVHIHYDCLYHIMPFLTCKKLGITSHFPYIDILEKHGGYRDTFHYMCNNERHTIFALCQKDYDMFNTYAVNKSNIVLLLNGSNHNQIQPVNSLDEKQLSDKSMYLGKIEERKRQHVYCKIPNIDFYGTCSNNFRSNLSYKGELLRNDLPNVLKQYGNLVLLSDGESAPLVIKEGLMAGLPIVTNRCSAADLDMTLPFIDIIPDDKLNDLEYVAARIKDNMAKQHMYKDIRTYAVANFSWKTLVAKYLQTIQAI